MTTATISHTARGASSERRPAIDLLAERVALGLLRWTERRAESARTRPPQDASAALGRDERIRRMREKDAARIWSTSPFGHR